MDSVMRVGRNEWLQLAVGSNICVIGRALGSGRGITGEGNVDFLFIHLPPNIPDTPLTNTVLLQRARKNWRAFRSFLIRKSINRLTTSHYDPQCFTPLDLP